MSPFAEDRMDTHNAPLTPKSRGHMVRAVLERGMSQAAIVVAAIRMTVFCSK